MTGPITMIEPEGSADRARAALLDRAQQHPVVLEIMADCASVIDTENAAMHDPEACEGQAYDGKHWMAAEAELRARATAIRASDPEIFPELVYPTFAGLEPADTQALRSALDHIARTAARSRTSTRRLRWIEQRARWALDGKAYENASFDLPRDGGPETVQRLQARIARLNAELAELRGKVAEPAPAARACKLAECQGKPRCGTCLAMDAAYPGSGVAAC